MTENLPPTEKISRRPVYERFLRRKHHMRLDPPTETEIWDARALLAEPWQDELTEEARRVLKEIE